jgi:hypothetical protein
MYFYNDEPTRKFISKNKTTFINLINAQFMLRFPNNSFFLKEKMIPKKTSVENVIYTLNTLDGT